MKGVVATICILPERLDAARLTLKSLSPQVDKIYVCLNDFEKIPPEIERFKNVEVIYVGENIGAVGRFSRLPKIDCHLISCDDDLVYPSTYVDDFLAAHENNKELVFTHHGKNIVNQMLDYKARCLHKSTYSGPIEIIGVGVSFFPKGKTDWTEYMLEEPMNQTDIHVSVMMDLLGYKAKSIPHSSKYFKYLKPPTGTTIWERETRFHNLVTLFDSYKKAYEKHLKKIGVL